jgi:hypothetical protein
VTVTWNVDGVEVTWDNDNIYVRFTDLFGDGEQYGFPPDEMERIRDLLTEALIRHREGY